MRKIISVFLAFTLLMAAVLTAQAAEAADSDPHTFSDRYGHAYTVSADAFAARAESEKPGNPWTDNETYQKPDRALGTDDGLTYVLGVGGSLVLSFDSRLTDGEGKDIFVFETVYFDEKPENVLVEVSDDLSEWFEIGTAVGYTDGLDMKGKVPEGAGFRYVRLTDLGSDPGCSLPGADIDAVCGLYPAPLSAWPAPEAEGKPGNNSENEGKTGDTTSWKQALQDVLQEHSEAIHACQEQTMSWWTGQETVLPFHPVGLKDLNGDGIPELMLMEMNANGKDWDLSVWGVDGNKAECVIALPKAVNEDTYSQACVYTIADGSAVIEYYWEEGPGQVSVLLGNVAGKTVVKDRMFRQSDGIQGEKDRFFRNGEEITREEWKAVTSAWQNGKKDVLFQFPWPEKNCAGFEYTWEEAIVMLETWAGGVTETAEPVPEQNAEEVPEESAMRETAPMGEKVMRTVRGKTNVRRTASANSAKVVVLTKKGTEVTILDEVKDETGETWYYIRTPKGKLGYIRADLLEP